MAEPAEKPKPDFRLMDLNYWCRRQMISHWDIKKQVAFSHCSKECFNLVKSLNQKPIISIQLDGLERIDVQVDTDEFLIKFVDPEIAPPGYETPINFGLSARDAFVHLCEMYHHKELTVRLNRDSVAPLDAVKTLFDGFPINTIVYFDGSNLDEKKTYMKNMLEFLLPSKSLKFERGLYDSYEEFRDNILQFEYENLTLQHLEHIDLLDLKSINADLRISLRPLERRFASVTQQFQGFIQKWIKSETYPKFKSIVIYCESGEGVEGSHQEKVLDGLLYRQLPNVKGVYEVQREADGQKADISFEIYGKMVLWKFFVV